MGAFKSYNLRAAEANELQHRREAEHWQAEVDGYERLIDDYRGQLERAGAKPRDRAYYNSQIKRTGTLLARASDRATEAWEMHGKSLAALEVARAHEEARLAK